MFSIELWENLADADTFIEGLTGLFSKWKHSTRSVGGNWFGEGEYIGPTTDMEVFFLTNLGRRIKVTGGGIAWWEGQIGDIQQNRRQRAAVGRRGKWKLDSGEYPVHHRNDHRLVRQRPDCHAHHQR
jgi:hypothetical protein